MKEGNDKELLDLLEKIVENQNIQITRQAEALEMQRIQFQKAENLTARAENVQRTSLKLIKFAAGIFVLLVSLSVLNWLF